MPGKKSRHADLPRHKPRQSGSRGDSESFPDEAHVRAFAEYLLQDKRGGTYEPVQSERRTSPSSAPRSDPASARRSDPSSAPRSDSVFVSTPQSAADTDRGSDIDFDLDLDLDRGLDSRDAEPNAEAETTLQAASPATASLERAVDVRVAQTSKTVRSASNSDAPAAEPGECLSEDAILAFVQGRLGRAELVAAHGHLEVCNDCQRLIVEAAHAVSLTRSDRSQNDSLGPGLRPGTVLNDRYRIQRFVARGGMGEVFEAYDRVLKERIALKTVVGTVTDNPRAVRRLMAEVQLARRVSHPNVCRIYDLGSHQVDKDSALHFLSMEFVDGMSLGEKLEREGPMPVKDALWVARQLLSALEAAHEAGILHRDFKPDNIMLRSVSGERPRALVMDFGLARALDVDPGRLTTGANQPLIGTLSYMAPEQVEGGKLTAGTDIFAFGIVFFEMLTGCLPFIGGSPAATALRRLKEPPPAPSEYAAEVPKYIDKIVLRCLARHPRDRYARAVDVLADIDAGVARPSPVASGGRPPKWLALAALGLLLLGVVSWFGLSGSDRGAERAPVAPRGATMEGARPELPPRAHIERAPEPQVLPRQPSQPKSSVIRKARPAVQAELGGRSKPSWPEPLASVPTPSEARPAASVDTPLPANAASLEGEGEGDLLVPRLFAPEISPPAVSSDPKRERE